jgi:feruloyl esterase
MDILRRMNMRIAFFVGVVLAASTPVASRAQFCEGLAKLSSPTVAITVAKTIEAGSYTPAGSEDALASLPAFCRVTATLKPTPDSDIQTELWLPISNWNGKYVAIGNGGWGGAIGGEAYEEMGDALRRGYATSATDDGHADHGAAFALGHPEKSIDFAYRADREMTVEAKALIKAFYGREARYSYWNGCSGGGREGLLQAYRYPDEFDGIIAGDPANINRNTWALWIAVHAFKDPADYIPPAKYPMIHRAVLEACDAKDGVKDGLIEDPEKCRVDFKVLECKGADGADCLTARQVQTAQIMISPVKDSAGHVVFPRLEPGTELRWARLAGGPDPADLFWDQFRYIVYKDPKWDWRTFDVDRDAAKALEADKDFDELDPRLAEFARRGGKLLIYHGWADQQVAPGSSVEFYKSAIDASGKDGDATNWIRLFMVPGMAHCSGGEGPDTFDKLSVMERWVEKGEAPERIVASHSKDGHVDRTRPLCPYPQVASYKGSGSIDEAANFVCRLPQ